MTFAESIQTFEFDAATLKNGEKDMWLVASTFTVDGVDYLPADETVRRLNVARRWRMYVGRGLEPEREIAQLENCLKSAVAAIETAKQHEAAWAQQRGYVRDDIVNIAQWMHARRQTEMKIVRDEITKELRKLKRRQARLQKQS